jgi:hypothetical protein
MSAGSIPRWTAAEGVVAFGAGDGDWAIAADATARESAEKVRRRSEKSEKSEKSAERAVEGPRVSIFFTIPPVTRGDDADAAERLHSRSAFRRRDARSGVANEMARHVPQGASG